MNSSFNYLPQNERKKIMLICDDIRVHSGVATIAKELVLNTAQHFNWVNIAGAINHPEKGKRFDLSQDTNTNTKLTDASVFLYPVDNYGDADLIRHMIEVEKPDAIMLITDPRYFEWLFAIENEIRKHMPIIYLNIWDDYPAPLYNKAFYESCDALLAISKQTKLINELVLDEKRGKKIIEYVPHGLNHDVYYPIVKENELKELETLKSTIFGGKEKDFVVFFNSRNIRRKQTSDVIYSYRLFCDMLPKEKSDKCILIMHTTPIDNNGTDLYAVVDKICPDYRVELHGTKIEATLLNQLYNVADCTINIANNEGFGLSTAESLMAGTPIIVSVTGGLQDQCGFEYTADDYINIETLSNKKKHNHTPHGVWVNPIWPTATNINGSPLTPYIYDDRVNDYDVANAIFEFYNMGRDVRKEKGLKGREWALNNLSSKIMCDALINGIETTLEKFQPRKKYDLYKIV